MLEKGGGHRILTDLSIWAPLDWPIMRDPTFSSSPDSLEPLLRGSALPCDFPDIIPVHWT